MIEFSRAVLQVGKEGLEGETPSCRDLLRSATNETHERLHLHAGFAALKHGTITLPAYRALLMCLYGFYRPFECAVGVDRARTQWLASDLEWLGVEATARSEIPVCANIPRYECPERRLGALYVVEGSALGGRVLCRGLDQLLSPDSVEGRRFLTGHGAHTGDAWRSFLDTLELVGFEPIGRTALVNAAVETFEVFETWLSEWNKIK